MRLDELQEYKITSYMVTRGTKESGYQVYRGASLSKAKQVAKQFKDGVLWVEWLNKKGLHYSSPIETFEKKFKIKL